MNKKLIMIQKGKLKIKKMENNFLIKIYMFKILKFIITLILKFYLFN